MQVQRGSVSGLWATLLFALACDKPLPPTPTVAKLTPSREGVTVRASNTTHPVPLPKRVEAGTEVRTGKGVRASLMHDTGAFFLVDSESSLTVTQEGFALTSGRVWVDARKTEPVKISLGTPVVTLSLKDAGVAVTSKESAKAEVYCASGQVTWTLAGGAGGGRLESGLSLILAGGQAKETAQSLWEDWTSGLAEPGPLRPLDPAGVGQLLGRRPGQVETPRVPVTVRQHEVRVRIRGDLAETEVEQTFFNGSPEYYEGLYTVRLPEDAILADFALGEEGETPQSAMLLPQIRQGESAPGAPQVQLEWSGLGRYRGFVREIRPGKTKVIRLRYLEWLPRRKHPGGTRRSYVYPMGQSTVGVAGEVQNLGEFSLEVDVGSALAMALEAGMGAQVDGRRVVLRRSDFRPRADFILDLLDKDDEPLGTPAYRGESHAGVRYLLTQPVLAQGAAPKNLDLLLVLDVSAGTDLARLDLARSTARALLSHLQPTDRVGILAAALSPRTLSRDALAPATPARIEELIDAMGKEIPAGATDLGAALEKAVSLLPQGHGAILYLGDGRPTSGAILPADLRAQVARLSPLPRIYAAAIGADANLELLRGLCEGGESSVLTVEDRPESIRTALSFYERISKPALTGVSVSLGEGADVVYPEGEVTLEAGDALQVVARLRPDRNVPTTMTVKGIRAGAPFVEVHKLKVQDLDDGGDLSRRFARQRLLRLLTRGAGREAAMDLGIRFGLVTPWTAYTIGAAGASYVPIGTAGSEASGVFVPPALRGLPPTDTALTLEGGVATQPVRTIGIEALYERALLARQAPLRLCYDRKAAGHPELSGRLTVQVRIALDGAVTLAKVVSSTLRDRDVEGCIERATAALRLPPSPDGKPHEVNVSLQLEQDASEEVSTRCSAASRAYLAARRALWRERIQTRSSVAAIFSVWKEARSRCELKSWVDRRALLDLMRPAVGRTLEQVDLYHRFDGDPDQAEVQEHLRREILRAVRTPEDVQAAQAGLMLSGGVDPGLVEQELAKQKTLPGKISVVRQFLQLAPSAMALKLRLLSLLREAGDKVEARRLCDSLRGDPGADAAVRQAVGEYLISVGEGAEGARTFSEIVEFAPFDPWGRRRLGDLYRAHKLYEAAYREYQLLGWLLPQEETVFLLLSGAAFQAGRSDEALRLLSRVGEAVGTRPSQNGPAAWARALYAVRLAQLLSEADKRGDKNLIGALRQRGRVDGVAGYTGELLIALTYDHPDAGLQLFVRPQGPAQDTPTRAEVLGGAVGIEAQRYLRLADKNGQFGLVVRRPGGKSSPAFAGEVLSIWNAGNEGDTSEKISRIPVQLGAGVDEVFLTLQKGEIRK